MEIWKDIINYDSCYQISSLGNVKSLKRLSKNQFKTFILNEKILKNGKGSGGYLYINLYKNSTAKNIMIHRLVALAFIPNIENKPQVNHKNGIKTDNRVENLEWCTNSENMKHAYINNLNIPIKGEDNVNSKLKNEDILEIRSGKLTRKELRIKYNVGQTTIHNIISYKKWKNI